MGLAMRDWEYIWVYHNWCFVGENGLIAQSPKHYTLNIKKKGNWYFVGARPSLSHSTSHNLFHTIKKMWTYIHNLWTYSHTYGVWTVVWYNFYLSCIELLFIGKGSTFFLIKFRLKYFFSSLNLHEFRFFLLNFFNSFFQ